MAVGRVNVGGGISGLVEKTIFTSEVSTSCPGVMFHLDKDYIYMYGRDGTGNYINKISRQDNETVVIRLDMPNRVSNHIELNAIELNGFIYAISRYDKKIYKINSLNLDIIDSIDNVTEYYLKAITSDGNYLYAVSASNDAVITKLTLDLIVVNSVEVGRYSDNFIIDTNSSHVLLCCRSTLIPGNSNMFRDLIKLNKDLDILQNKRLFSGNSISGEIMSMRLTRNHIYLAGRKVFTNSNSQYITKLSMTDLNMVSEKMLGWVVSGIGKDDDNIFYCFSSYINYHDKTVADAGMLYAIDENLQIISEVNTGIRRTGSTEKYGINTSILCIDNKLYMTTSGTSLLKEYVRKGYIKK